LQKAADLAGEIHELPRCSQVAQANGCLGFFTERGREMKMTATIILIVVLGFASLGWGESPPVRRVEVVNDSLNVDIQNQPVDVNVANQPVDTNVANWPDTQDVNIVQSPILDVRLVDQPEPVQYEYYAFEGEGPNMLDVLNLLKPGENEYWTIPDLLNQKATEGFDLYFFIVSRGDAWPQHYIVIMRRPVQ